MAWVQQIEYSEDALHLKLHRLGQRKGQWFISPERGLQPLQNLIGAIMAQNLCGQQHFQNLSITLQLRIETTEGVQSGHNAKTKPAVSDQQVPYEYITGQSRAYILKDQDNLLAHTHGYGRVVQLVTQRTDNPVTE